jgi:hypothetical protein
VKASAVYFDCDSTKRARPFHCEVHPKLADGHLLPEDDAFLILCDRCRAPAPRRPERERLREQECGEGAALEWRLAAIDELTKNLEAARHVVTLPHDDKRNPHTKCVCVP